MPRRPLTPEQRLAKKTADRKRYHRKKHDPAWVAKERQRKREAARQRYAHLQQDPEALEGFLAKRRGPKNLAGRQKYAMLKAQDSEALKQLAHERNQKHRAKDPERSRQRLRDWRKKNAEKNKSYADKNRALHQSQWREYRQRFYEKHGAQYFHGYVAARIARKHNAPINDLTPAQWKEIQAAHGHRCVYCGRKMQRLTQDHITPLSRGGNHTASNIVPACQSCNSKKNVGAPLRPVQPMLLTLAPPKERKNNE